MINMLLLNDLGLVVKTILGLMNLFLILLDKGMLPGQKQRKQIIS